MQNTWAEKLKTSIANASAFGFLIDYQEEFLETTTMEAFHNGKRLAESFRESGVKPLWVCWPDLATAPLCATYGQLKEQGVFKPRWHQKIDFFQRMGFSTGDVIDDFAIALPNPEEIVFTKQHMNALTNSEAKAFIKAQRKATYIAGGVLADKCFGSSVKDLLDNADCDVIVPYDASNFHDEREAREYFTDSRKTLFKRKGRCHITSTDEVIATLSQLDI